MNTGILLQARCNSKRFPEKVLKKINKKTMLETILLRLSNLKKIKLIVVTTKHKSDNKIVDILKKNKVSFYRGKTKDVLSRFYNASIKYKIKTIIRCNADCPFIDFRLINKMLRKFKKKRYDYLSNILEPSYPSGMHIEIFNFETLKKINKLAKDISDREHVTPYIYKNPKKFNIYSYKQKIDMSKHRWTVDYPEDLLFTRKVYNKLNYNNNFNMSDVLKILNNNPDLKKINYFLKKNQNLLK